MQLGYYNMASRYTTIQECMSCAKFHISIQRILLTGRPIQNMLGMRLRIAASTSCGLFVAPTIIIWQLPSVTRPSQKLMNCVFIIAVASWSVDVLDLRNESGRDQVICTSYNLSLFILSTNAGSEIISQEQNFTCTHYFKNIHLHKNTVVFSDILKCSYLFHQWR